MGFYIILIASCYSALFSLVVLLFTKEKPPEKWGEKAYSKCRFAIWLNKMHEKSSFLSSQRVDLFHFIGLIVSTLIAFASLIVFFVDLAIKFTLYQTIGLEITIIITFLILILPIFYEVFLRIWWSILNKDSLINKDLKRLKKIKKQKK